ncbi:GNAT family N-acetyltransferase [Caenimonas aquaedulcis]|uniref:GNAT family N-acetyltransferase n=1 Tax=Caenimonas aquaedulcis TaxID=2793270 RepID=A0A931MES8_9BURK|nr:GNAT family protein [Caenimonas aquaedulcis]MBG9386838.1 GNAT family N-acetyltransferase [Caenimonas aquaedulcis]
MSGVRLDRVSARDQADFLEAAGRSARLHAPWVTAPATPEAFRALVKRSREPANASYVVRHARTGALVGIFNISNIVCGSFHSAYLGYYAFAGHERQGLMREGLRLLLRTAFTELKLHRLEANIQPANAASIALVRSCGFQLEGYSPRYLKIRGRWRDHERWAILAR